MGFPHPARLSLSTPHSLIFQSSSSTQHTGHLSAHLHLIPAVSNAPGHSLASPESPPAVGSSCGRKLCRTTRGKDTRLPHVTPRTPDCPVSPQGLLSLSPKEGSTAGSVPEEQAAPEGLPSPALSASRSNPPRGNAIPCEHSRLQACQKLLHSPREGQKDILCK